MREMKTTIKQQVQEEVDRILAQGKEVYFAEDFSNIDDYVGGSDKFGNSNPKFLTYQRKIMNKYLYSLGYEWCKYSGDARKRVVVKSENI